MSCKPPSKKKKKKSGCGCEPEEEIYQDWSKAYDLKRNLSLDDLIKEMEKYKEQKSTNNCCDEIVYVYIVATAKVINNQIFQTGTAPNFEGRLITLTNCKHWMRCSKELKDYLKANKLWIAGVTTTNRKYNPYRIPFLFYLMKVDKGFESFLDLWNNLPQKAKNHKNARNNKLDDLYEPKPNCNNNTKYDPNYYYPPHQNHVHNKCKIYQNQPNCWSFCTRDIGCWVKDITYCRISNRKAYVHSNNSK